MKIVYKFFHKGKERTLKRVEDMTLKEVEAFRLSAIRAALHRAVDMGLLDGQVKELNQGMKEDLKWQK